MQYQDTDSVISKIKITFKIKNVTMEPDKHPNRKILRMPNYNYSANGLYFITIVTQNRICYFGNPDTSRININEAGKMIEKEYIGLEKRHKEIVCLDYVIMPNHIHFILQVNDNDDDGIPDIIDEYKSRTTVRYIKSVKEQGWSRFNGKLWQRSYWDDIIRNERQLRFIQNYIFNNPIRWNKDALNNGHDDDVDNIESRIRELR